MIAEGCEVNYSFKKGFILNEEHIKYISAIIHTRYDEKIIYKIVKSNSYIYQTEHINELLNEENGKANFINELDIIMNKKGELCLCLCFKKGMPSVLKIIGTEKDKVFMLYNELKNYIEKEVTTVRTFSLSNTFKGVCLVLSMGLLFVGVLFYMYFLSNTISDGLEEVISSSDIMVKLNYIIAHQGGADVITFEKYKFVFLPIILLSFLLIFFSDLFEVFWGKNGILVRTDYFLIGNQRNLYYKRTNMWNNVIWVIGVGFIVGVLAGLLVYFITK